MSFTRLENGDILFHKRGDAPVPPPNSNFIADTNDPYIWHAKFPECPNLMFKNMITKCGKMYGAWWCKEYKETTTVKECNGCEKRQELIKLGMVDPNGKHKY